MAAIDVSPRAPGASVSRLTKAAAEAATGIRIITRPSSTRDSTAVQARHASEKPGRPRFSVDHRSADRLRMSCRGGAMGGHVLRDVKLGLVVLALSVGAALAAPVNSDLATAQLGGGGGGPLGGGRGGGRGDGSAAGGVGFSPGGPPGAPPANRALPAVARGAPERVSGPPRCTPRGKVEPGGGPPGG